MAGWQHARYVKTRLARLYRIWRYGDTDISEHMCGFWRVLGYVATW
jgi:hypothetical protein